MSLDTADTTVRSSIVVDAPVERCFDVYVHQMGSWWPEDHHLLRAEFAEMVVEARPGGRIYELGTDGSECQWSTVIAYEPPTRFVFAWQISPRWEVETDLARASEVEITFTDEGDGRTRVDLEHRHLDRHGEGWEGIHAAVVSPGGWPGHLRSFAAQAAGR